MSARDPVRACLCDTAELNTVLDRMASQAAALLHGAPAVAVVGILRRGAPLAEIVECQVPSDEPEFRVELGKPARPL